MTSYPRGASSTTRRGYAGSSGRRPPRARTKCSSASASATPPTAAPAASARACASASSSRKLAQALLHDPDVLVLDEPLTGLDPVMRRDFISIIRELGKEGVTILVSSHVLHEIEAMTNTIVLLHHGQVLAEGTVQHIRDLLDKYARRIRISTPEPRELARELLQQPDLISGLELIEGGVIIETLEKLAAEGRAIVEAVEPIDEDLTSVFSYLVD